MPRAFSRSLTVLSAALSCALLSGCEDFSARVPGPVTPPAPPAQDARFVPPPGEWSGAPLPGPWCAPAAPLARQMRAAAADLTARRVTADLRGASLALTRLSGEARVSAALLPAQTPEELEAWLRTQGAQVRGRSSGFVLAELTAAQAKAALAQGQARYAEPLARPGRPQAAQATPAPIQTQGLPGPTEPRDPATETYFAMTGVRPAWALLEQGCAPVVIAVIDTGWSSDPAGHLHNLVPKRAWFDATTGRAGGAPSSVSPAEGRDHGAQVGSVIAQTVNGEGEGYSLAYNLAKVLPIGTQIQDGEARGELDPVAIALGIDYALGQAVTAQGVVTNPYPAQIINLSLGAPGEGSEAESALITAQATRAAAAGTLMVAAAGNDGSETLSNYALAEPTLAVAGLDRSGARWTEAPPAGSPPGTPAPGSSRGAALDLAAPAQAVPLTYNRQMTQATGTSFAAPWASAQLALWMIQNRHLTGDHARGLRGEALYAAVRRCLAAAGTQPKDDQLGVGAVQTNRLVDPATPACRQ